MVTENEKFIEWYNALQGYQRRFAARQICDCCSISRPTLTRWLQGESEIKNPYRIIINRIAGKEIFQTRQIQPLTMKWAD